ncbi:MAG: hypothetical protein HY075_13750 [Deltaproteobacteria bacterium]|nr:hypothetical protein [Deltaproteobacteria bacterium]
MRTIAGILAFGILSLSPNAHAMRFANNFVEFELPAHWQCGLVGAEWVCQSHDEKQKRDAIVVLAAKLKGDKDTLDEYQKYLEKPRAFTGVNGKALTSLPKYARTKAVNGQLWVDSLHLESEIPNYYTRYLATAKNDIGVLVTYSVFKEKYAAYDGQFEDMIASLKVFRKGPLGAQQFPMIPGGGEGFRPYTIAQTPAVQAAPPQTSATPPSDDGAHRAAGGLIFLVMGVAAALCLWRRQN